MTPPPSSHSSPAPYHRVTWPLIIQGGGLVLALIGLFVASTKYPIVDWIGNARESIQQLGVWSGVVYPITYALCNLLLLPGGVLSMGGGFFFGLWWGFFLVLAGNLLGAALAFLITPDDQLGTLSPLEALQKKDARLKERTLRLARAAAGDGFS